MAGNNFFWYASSELLFPQFNLNKAKETSGSRGITFVKFQLQNCCRDLR